MSTQTAILYVPAALTPLSHTLSPSASPLLHLPLLPAQATHIIHSYHQRSQRRECCKRQRDKPRKRQQRGRRDAGKRQEGRRREAGEWRKGKRCKGGGSAHQGEMSDGSEYRAYRHRCHCVSVTSSHPRNVSAVAQLASTSQLPHTTPSPSHSMHALPTAALPCLVPLDNIAHTPRITRCRSSYCQSKAREV